MSDLIIRIYTYLRAHRLTGLLAFFLLTGLLAFSTLRLGYKEDIADFLPLDADHQNALAVYQDIAGADKVFVLLQCRDTARRDPDALVEAAGHYVSAVRAADSTGMARSLTAQVDMERLTAVTDFVYARMPYFLTEDDYARMDSLLRTPGFVERQVREDKHLLMFPSGGLLADNMGRDPLGLFTPVAQQLQHAADGLRYELYDGYIFSPDMRRTIVMIDSPFGSSETEHNAALTDLLTRCARTTEAACAGVEIHVTGGPVIAVGNARQIKTDSILSVSLAVALILALLLLTIRNVRNLLLIAVSIAWGWLFAMGCLALVHDSVSIIVIGISSVIVGIAVNYPLHFIAHLSHTPDRKKALREIVAPLVVGNVTTVGAFLALVPLQSAAMCDLGLFSSFLLVGTILFVLLFLPHVTAVRTRQETGFFGRLGDVSLEDKPWAVAVVAALTLVFAYFSLDTRFDADMSHINYMTDEQKTDMAYFQRVMTDESGVERVYALSTDTTLDAALDRSRRLQPALQALEDSGLVVRRTGCKQFLCSEREQRDRLARWRAFVDAHGARLRQSLTSTARAEGFAEGSFDDFLALMDGRYAPLPVDSFSLLTRSAFASNVSIDTLCRSCNVVDVLSVHPDDVRCVEDRLAASGCHSFDIQRMNSAIANHLSDDFNYIGWACGCIVFFFLWLSLGSIELAILSFVPMAVSWVWILGIMSLLGIQFNIVNVILATFIFGQGDDYTIFMTEGACYEYACRRRMLASYKHSIVISALIMFIGIGTLIVARHPALHSLAEVTIAGMFSVVLMAYVFPPLIFNRLVRSGGQYRVRPVSLVPLVRGVWRRLCLSVRILPAVVACTARRQPLRVPGVRVQDESRVGEAFAVPAVIVGAVRPMLLVAVVLASGCRVVWLCPERDTLPRAVRFLLRRLGHAVLPSDCPDAILQPLCKEGHSLVVLTPRGTAETHLPKDCAARALMLARRLHLGIVPLGVHGLDMVSPGGTLCLYRGHIVLSVGRRVDAAAEWGDLSDADGARMLAAHCDGLRHALAAHRETAAYFHDFVVDRYRYKGVDVFAAVRSSLRRNHDFEEWIDEAESPSATVVLGTGYGEFALLYALVHGATEVYVPAEDDERADIVRYSAEGVAPNLHVVSHEDLREVLRQHGPDGISVFAQRPVDEAESLFAGMKIHQIGK